MASAVRTFLRPDAPYFAHFFVTERCNLECSYCNVWRKPAPELDLAGAKRVVDRVASMGVGCLSLTGGEPLLRPDLTDLIAHSASHGMYTRVTSNALVGRERYDRLLASPVDAFSLSIDGVGPSRIPYAKVGERNRDTIAYVAARRGAKRMDLSCVVHEANVAEVRALVQWVARELPGIPVFLQPVVTGRSGSFRRADQPHLACVDALAELKRDFPGVVANTSYFNRFAAWAAANPDDHRWGCRAGRQFFDVKPDGRFWICQDIPTGLNVLDDDFPARLRALDTRAIAARCSGCTYSCYLETQKAFEVRNVVEAATRFLRVGGTGGDAP
jgi:MoaA/NifB/PqqE/SkfB family radical SAM enzyme